MKSNRCVLVMCMYVLPICTVFVEVYVIAVCALALTSHITLLVLTMPSS